MTALPRSAILVADDSAETLAMLSDVLESAGFTAFVALRGDRALSIARQVTPDLILLDAIMPGMDGFETCRALKREPALARVPVIFMTGLSEPEDVVRGLEAGGVDYVTKPIEPQGLLARIRVHLANARVEKSARAALDSAGRYLLAADEEGHLLWWTPQAGALMAATLSEPLAEGVRLPEPLAQALAASPDANRLDVLLPREGGESIHVQGVGRLAPGEILLRVSEAEAAMAGSVEERLRQSYQISAREAEVLNWLSQGKTNRDIAEILNVSPRTVNKHLERIFRKIGVENRTAAAAIVLALKH
ncbi:MAG: response regulator transcription factor [Proteobacteria bacterium]|nr:response regulator transcription factor [Pseudomonadota bacterium]